MTNNKNLHNSASLNNFETENRRKHKANVIINGILFTQVVSISMADSTLRIIYRHS